MVGIKLLFHNEWRCKDVEEQKGWDVFIVDGGRARVRERRVPLEGAPAVGHLASKL